MGFLRTNEQSTVHISDHFCAWVKKALGDVHSCISRMHNLCIFANFRLVLTYSGVQLTMTVLHQAYSTLAFTLKWPHAAMTVVPHTAFFFFLPRTIWVVLLSRGYASCALAHACVFCAWVCITNKLWWQNARHLCTREISHSCSCLSRASILIRDEGQSSQGSEKATSSSLLASHMFTAMIFNNVWSPQGEKVLGFFFASY